MEVLEYDPKPIGDPRTRTSILPFVLGQAAQKVILEGQDVLDPTLGAKIVMEAAIPMSKIDPSRVKYAYTRALAEEIPKLHVVEKFCVDYEMKGKALDTFSRLCSRDWGVSKSLTKK